MILNHVKNVFLATTLISSFNLAHAGGGILPNRSYINTKPPYVLKDLNVKLIRDKETRLGAKIIRYNDEKKSYDQWLKEFRNYGNTNITEHQELMWLKYRSMRTTNSDGYFADYNLGTKMLMEGYLVKIWNEQVAKHPYNKNARSAFCSYGKEMFTPLLNNAIVCDKNFQLKKEHLNYSHLENVVPYIKQLPTIK